MSIQILATADIHIGRRPTRIPHAADAHRFSAARMWEDVVARAVQENVDLVALAGDVVDHDNRFLEATGPLERGLEKLHHHGIRTFAVAGNHDCDVFPRLADVLGPDCLQMLGRSGQWEEAWFTAAHGEQLRIHGWSFPEPHVPTSPLVDYHMDPSDTPTLGLLHADLDVPDSHYAPVMRSELNARPVTLWLLGHVHAPSFREDTGGPHLLYPGSPQPMDPGEPGPHGPWIIDVSGPRQLAARQLTMARVRYEELTIDLTGMVSKAEFESQISQCVRRFLDQVAESSRTLEYLSLRLRLTGRTPVFAEIPGWLGPLTDQLARTSGQVAAGIDKVLNHTRPELDLRELSQKRDLCGTLARFVLQLQSASQLDEETNALLQETRERIRGVHDASVYARIDRDAVPGEEGVREKLVGQAMLLLDTLRAREVRA